MLRTDAWLAGVANLFGWLLLAGGARLEYLPVPKILSEMGMDA